MRMRISREAQIVEWFQEAPLATAKTMLGIIQAALKKRNMATATTACGLVGSGTLGRKRLSKATSVEAEDDLPKF